MELETPDRWHAVRRTDAARSPRHHDHEKTNGSIVTRVEIMSRKEGRTASQIEAKQAVIQPCT